MSKIERYGGLVLGAVALYIVYKAFQTGKSVVSTAQAALTASQGAVADTLYHWFGPTENFGPGTYLTVTFVEPGGPRHAIGADQIEPDGTFTYAGKQYRLANNQQGQHFAVPIS